MDELLKIGDKNNRLGEEVEMSDFERKLQFAKSQIPEFNDVVPTPVFCVKTKHLKPDGNKVFLNICHSSAVPRPPPITEEELQRRVEEAERDNLTVTYRIPISLGELREEKDNKGKAVDVFDIVVNEGHLKHLEEEKATYQIGFLVSVAIQGLEEKYGLDLDRNWIMLKNRKAMGKPTLQRIRKYSKNPKLEEVRNEGERPEEIKIHRAGTNIHASMKLDKMQSVSQLTLEMNLDSIKVSVKPDLYFTEVWLEELQLDHDRAQASFDHKTKVLSIVTPIF